MSQSKKLIVGLGNPGEEYDGSRHNVGFMALDRYANLQGTELKSKDKFSGDIGDFELDGTKIILLKPQTYYNLVGNSIRPVKDFYKIENEDILIVHDELDLPFGTIRTRTGAADAGNHGVQHIIKTVGPHTTRIRIGTHNDFADKVPGPSFVLGKFLPEELEDLDKVLGEAVALMALFAHGKMPHVTFRLENESKS
jgi:peptidyl-tRNA hydrolase, PTH1 family